MWEVIFEVLISVYPPLGTRYCSAMITPRPATPIHNQGPRRIRFTPDILSGRPRTPQFGQGALQEPALAVEIEGERRPERLPRPAAGRVADLGGAPHRGEPVAPHRGDAVLV